MYLARYKRRKRSTIDARLRQLRFMARHPVAPVNLHGTREELLNSFYGYVTFREENEGAPPSALSNDHTSIRVLGDFLGIPREAWPTAPTLVKHEDDELPTPEMVYDLRHTDWTPNPKFSYTNHLVRGLLVFDFLLGPRFPSEAWALRLADFRPEEHELVITEPKKSGKRRRLLVEPEWVCCSRRHPRQGGPRAEAGGLLPHQQGDALRIEVHGGAVPVQPREVALPVVLPYLGRHWNANARLVEWGFDYVRVANWMGHEDVKMLRKHYEHSARLYRHEYGDQWLMRAARQPRRATISERSPKKGLLAAPPPVGRDARARI